MEKISLTHLNHCIIIFWKHIHLCDLPNYMVLLFIYIYTHTYQTNAKISPTKFSPFPFIFFRISLGPVCEMAHREKHSCTCMWEPHIHMAFNHVKPQGPPTRTQTREGEREMITTCEASSRTVWNIGSLIMTVHQEGNPWDRSMPS